MRVFLKPISDGMCNRLAAAGEFVTITPFWRQRLAAGDVAEAIPGADADADDELEQSGEAYLVAELAGRQIKVNAHMLQLLVNENQTQRAELERASADVERAITERDEALAQVEAARAEALEAIEVAANAGAVADPPALELPADPPAVELDADPAPAKAPTKPKTPGKKRRGKSKK